MTVSNGRWWLALGAVAALATTAAAQQSANVNATVVETGVTHVVGNPAAKVTLAEYVSYTCPHCAHFANEGDGALKLVYVPSGKVKLEIHPFLRNPLDIAASLLVRCGDPASFSRNHASFMLQQAKWLPLAQNATAAQQQRWVSGLLPERMRAIAGDLGFYQMMEANGYQRPELDRCLADEAAVKEMIDGTKAAYEKGVQGTPSFAINGQLLDGVHDWTSLRPHLDAAVTGS